MPTYDYRCEACGHELEVFQSITASPKRKCPECRRLKLKRIIGMGAGIIFKGSGFYETDYRSDSYKADAKKETSSNDASDSKQASAKDTKSTPAKKPKPSSDTGNDASSSSTKP